MANQVFGEVSYSDDSGKFKKNTNNKDQWMRLVDGENEIRLLTAPYQYVTHKYKKVGAGTKDYGEKVGCTMIHGSCQLCDAAEAMEDDAAKRDAKAKQRWFYGILDRKTGAYKILDVSYAVYSGIRDLARNAKWGDPTKYDINILVKKDAAPNEYYTVQPIPKEPLTAAEQSIKDKADLEDLKRRCQPLTLEQQQKRLDRINGLVDTDAKTTKSVAKTVTKSAAAPAVELATDDTELEDFPPYDGEEASA
jgi:hypothetical protein